MTVQVLTAADVERGKLDNFLAACFQPRKAAFLRDHGDWWHRGAENRWVLMESGAILGYCAVMPTRVRVQREAVDAAWWVDLVIDPAHRGRRLQRLFDDRVRGQPITLGFPNAVAAKIHRRHGWSVREDLVVRLAPLRPADMPSLARYSPAFRLALGSLLRLANSALGPRREALDAEVRRLDETVVTDLTRLSSTAVDCTTTVRDEAFLRWRYLEAPWPEQLSVVRSPRGAIVLRSVPTPHGLVVRVLDFVGRPQATEVGELVAAAVRHARSNGALQLTALASCRAVDRLFRDSGLFIRSRGRSCWYAVDPSVREALDHSEHFWTLGDADHDEP